MPGFEQSWKKAKAQALKKIPIACAPLLREKFLLTNVKCFTADQHARKKPAVKKISNDMRFSFLRRIWRRKNAGSESDETYK